MIATHNVVFALPPKLSTVTTTTTHSFIPGHIIYQLIGTYPTSTVACRALLAFFSMLFFSSHTLMINVWQQKKKNKTNRTKKHKSLLGPKKKSTLLGFLQEFDHLKKLTFTSLELNMQCLLSSMCIFLLLQLHK